MLCVALPRRRISAMLAEYQSKYIARVFAGKCTLPDTQTMLDAINRSIEQHKREHGSLKYALPLYRPLCIASAQNIPLLENGAV